MADKAPLELILTITDGPGILVELLNRSSVEQKYCHDSFWQSCDLALTDMSDHPIAIDDQRTRMMPDSPISEYAFGSLQPGERTELQASQFDRLDDGFYEFHWSHCVFYKIPPGDYFVVGTMVCQRDSWADKQRKWFTVEGIWKGTLRSNKAKIMLP
jgi:hypothetical protein